MLSQSLSFIHANYAGEAVSHGAVKSGNDKVHSHPYLNLPMRLLISRS